MPLAGVRGDQVTTTANDINREAQFSMKAAVFASPAAVKNDSIDGAAVIVP